MQGKMKVILLNGPSCAGKTTICREICQQSGDKFVHLQIDKAGEFYSTIFPKGFKFAENAEGTEENDQPLKGLYNNNRLARRKVIASILLSTGKEMLNQGYNIVIDTAFDGPDSKDLARLYLNYLKDYKVKFVGIFCPLEERYKRLKTRTDNLFLTEDFLKMQEDLFANCKEFYDVEFDSGKINGENIAMEILKNL